MKKSYLIGGGLLLVVIAITIYIYNKNKKAAAAAAGTAPAVVTQGGAGAALSTNATGATVVATPATAASVVVPVAATPANTLAAALGNSPSKVVPLTAVGTGIAGIKSNGAVIPVNHFSTATVQGGAKKPIAGLSIKI